MSDPGPTLAVRPGDPAPDLTLPSTAGGAVTRPRRRGERHVLLAFFPLGFTRVGPAECAVTDDFDRFASAPTQVYGVLVDRAGPVRWTFAGARLGDRRETAELLARVRELE
jgi:peroxiredoxin